MAIVREALEYAVLGVHQVPSSGTAGAMDAVATDVEWFDAIDLALRASDRPVVAFGLRTAGYLTSPHPDESWGGYVPLAVTLDLADVHYWDFNEILWIGPSPWPCLVWSNAECLSERSLDVLLAPDRAERLLAGPGGRGLPSFDDLRISAGDLAFRAITASPVPTGDDDRELD